MSKGDRVKQLYRFANTLNLGEWVVNSIAFEEFVLYAAEELSYQDKKIEEYQKEIDDQFQFSQAQFPLIVLAVFKSLSKEDNDV